MESLAEVNDESFAYILMQPHKGPRSPAHLRQFRLFAVKADTFSWMATIFANEFEVNKRVNNTPSRRIKEQATSIENHDVVIPKRASGYICDTAFLYIKNADTIRLILSAVSFYEAGSA